MESAIQVDLAKPEASAEQVLNSALGQAAIPPDNEIQRSASSNRRTEELRYSLQGGFATTTQARLDTKQSRHEFSPPIAEVERFDDEFTNVYTSQPVDSGFGAWSYVASAFAMYIVVWGEPRQIYCRQKPQWRF